MNRLLYQLSYAAMYAHGLDTAETSFLIISAWGNLVKKNFYFFLGSTPTIRLRRLLDLLPLCAVLP
jgi:hypothetical protein